MKKNILAGAAVLTRNHPFYQKIKGEKIPKQGLIGHVVESVGDSYLIRFSPDCLDKYSGRGHNAGGKYPGPMTCWWISLPFLTEIETKLFSDAEYEKIFI